MGGKTPRMDRGPFIGRHGPFQDDVILSIEPFTQTPSSELINLSSSFEVSPLTENFSSTMFTGGVGNGTEIGNSSTNIVFECYYPSCFSLPQIVFLAVLITVAMMVIVIGNMLVIIAIATEKSLKNITNWFIASLAVADLLLGLIIMPFSLAKLLMGYWIFGDLWCELHKAIDVLLSTASINNICLISLDRYWSITHAVAYLKKRTPERSAVMIIVVWVFSGLVSIPPLLGWKNEEVPEDLPQCEVSIISLSISFIFDDSIN